MENNLIVSRISNTVSESINRGNYSKLFSSNFYTAVICFMSIAGHSTLSRLQSIHKNSLHKFNWKQVTLVLKRVMSQDNENEQFLHRTFSLAAFQFPCSQIQSFHFYWELAQCRADYDKNWVTHIL